MSVIQLGILRRLSLFRCCSWSLLDLTELAQVSRVDGPEWMDRLQVDSTLGDSQIRSLIVADASTIIGSAPGGLQGRSVCQEK